jgi:hypothetical protein
MVFGSCYLGLFIYYNFACTLSNSLFESATWLLSERVVQLLRPLIFYFSSLCNQSRSSLGELRMVEDDEPTLNVIKYILIFLPAG